MSVHRHERASSGGHRELLVAFSLTVIMMVVEWITGWRSGSLALVADAGHMLTDASALALSFFAAWFATKPATLEKTYGYYRMEILAALANGVALWLIIIWIYVSAFQRLREPFRVSTGPMMLVATIGLAVNLFSGWILKQKRAGNLNIQGAWLNVMSDALGSVGVIVAGAVIQWGGWRMADPIASMFIGMLIAINSWSLVKQSVNILLEGTPGHVQMADVVQAVRSVPGVRDVHDVHLWTITTGMYAMSAHLMIEDVARSASVLSGLNGVLAEQFDITHTTFQLEPPSHVCHMPDPSH